MLLEYPERQPWQRLDGWGVLPFLVPWKLGQAIPGYVSWSWPGPPGSPPNPQGPGAKEVGRAGSPLPWGCLSTSLMWSCHVSRGPSPVRRAKLDPPVLLPACPRPCLWELLAFENWAEARVASTTVSCPQATWERGLCRGRKEAALPGLCAASPGLPPCQRSCVPHVSPPEPVDGSAYWTGPQLPSLCDGVWPRLGGTGQRRAGVEKALSGAQLCSSFSRDPGCACSQP